MKQNKLTNFFLTCKLWQHLNWFDAPILVDRHFSPPTMAVACSGLTSQPIALAKRDRLVGTTPRGQLNEWRKCFHLLFVSSFLHKRIHLSKKTQKQNETERKRTLNCIKDKVNCCIYFLLLSENLPFMFEINFWWK